MINVLMVEDSVSVRLMLRKILESDSRLNIVYMAGSGEEALEYLSLEPSPPVDVITMDIIMPGMDGFTATRRIMQSTPVPIVIVSAAYKPDQTQHSFEAMDAGAVAIVDKPVGIHHPDFDISSKRLIDTVLLMSEVKVVTHFSRDRRSPAPRSLITGAVSDSLLSICPVDLMAIGSSTGGPPALFTLLSALPADFPLPILVVQHICEGFIDGLSNWLEKGTGFPVHVPMDGDLCLAGHVYLAPDHFHMGISKGKRIVLERGTYENNQRPSVSYLFKSALNHFSCSTIGVMLSGMGVDGARELKHLRDSGCHTIAQEEASCVVFGMPGEAVKLGAATYVMPPEDMASKIMNIIKRGK